MGSAPVIAINPALKIKGGRWTVFKFFTVSVAYTSVWMAVSSQLGYYKHLYGPQVLLLLNIAYYAPSIPLLIFSSFFDEALEATLGITRTILLRLLVGLVGYGTICAWFPFMPQEIWVLLSAVVALGLFSGIAFSASYQLVARFANKNLIALGLGCIAGGPIVLVFEIALGMKATPTHGQQIWLYAIMTVIVAAGLWATVSLLVRHWDAIEASAAGMKHEDHIMMDRYDNDTGNESENENESERQALLLHDTAPMMDGEVDVDVDVEEGAGRVRTPRVSGGEQRIELAGAAATAGRPPLVGVSGSSPRSPSPLYHTPSLPPLLTYNFLEPYGTYLPSASEDWSPGPLVRTHVRQRLARRSLNLPLTQYEDEGEDGGGGGSRHVEDRNGLLRTISAPESELPGGFPSPSPSPSPRMWADASSDLATDDEEALNATHASTTAATAIHTQSPLRIALQGMWPALIAIGIQGGVALTLFPFFTYLPSSGTFGDSLPQILFFVRIFADITGRTLPRLSSLKPTTIWPVLWVALVKLSVEPLFFVYLKYPEAWHSDIAILVFVAAMWAASGYVNTTANMVAPGLVLPEYKSSAMALMAITYQMGHFLGLSIAAVMAYVLFGDIGVE